MIFGENSLAMDSGVVQESPYDLGYGGALMHVWENERNYNAIMKAVGISEMRYYNETGGDLLVQEAGAFSGFIDKVKTFFKKIIEKIKSIFQKFVAKINQFTMKDKDFVKKYTKELTGKNTDGFEFDGYEFGKLESFATVPYQQVTIDKVGYKSTDKVYGGSVSSDSTNDDVNDIIESNRGKIINDSSLDETEFKDKLLDKFYGNDGEKTTLENIKVYDWLGYITKTNDSVKIVDNAKKNTVNNIEKMIKYIDKMSSEIIKGISDSSSSNEKEGKSKEVSRLNNLIAVMKALSNDYTVYFSTLSKAVLDRNRQAKAICVKLLSYKHESASLYDGGAYSDDIFAGVEIV